MKRSKAPSSLSAITLLLSLVLLATWGASMYCLTAVTAEYAAARYLTSYEEFATTLSTRSLESFLGRHDQYQNYDLNCLWEAVSTGNQAQAFLQGTVQAEEGSGFFRRPDREQVYSAAAIYDGDGQLLTRSWEDFFYFEYLTQAQWDNREERSGDAAQAPFDRDKLTQEGKALAESNALSMEARAMRFVGTFDGVRFTPASIEYISRQTFNEVLFAQGGGSYTVSGLVQDHDLAWVTLYEDPNACPADAETVTFYSDWFNLCYEQPSTAFSYKGEEYGSPGELLEKLGPRLSSGRQSLVRCEGPDLLIPSVNYCFTIGDKTYYSPYFDRSYLQGDTPAELHFYTVSLIHCSPWRTALGELRNVYLLTLLLAAALVLLIRAIIKRNLIDPVRRIGEAMTQEGDVGGWYGHPTQSWREGQLLQSGFARYNDTLRFRKNEISHLNSTLEHTRSAEENRRKMTSTIAHELKTPLAVVHSYAEGLKERIAEEKRDKYLDVILSEVERMDAMVLEMLDLSRLEAGKVTLSLSDVSLIELTQAIFGKLDRAAQSRELNITFSFPEPFTIPADEERMAQVIENFATNAIKYTPQGGQVRVELQHRLGRTSFSIENESEYLSDDTLTKVWDTFYRADESRSSGGTGLGLAIAKLVVELHGGRCFARRTALGTMFGFTL